MSKVPIPRAHVPWRELKVDVLLISLGVIIPIVSLIRDAQKHQPDWFPRSGAVAALAGAVVAFRSLAKHYNKFLTALAESRSAPTTSLNQHRLDILAFVLSVTGTVIWAYGDKLFRFFA